MKIFLDANICLDLLDTKRSTSKKSLEWYMFNKDNERYEFYFSSDFITTFYYILTQKRKYSPKKSLLAIETLCEDMTPWYTNHFDFLSAKSDFFNALLEDFEDLIVLNSAFRLGVEQFITNDKQLLILQKFKNFHILQP